MRTSPLDAVHRALAAKMVPFGGWEMPLDYGSTIDEHLACRADAVVFDVSHLGSVRVTGDHGYDLLQRQLTNDLAKVGPGRAQYTHLLDEADGSVLDDIIVWWHPDGDGDAVFDVMPNASNTDGVLAAIGGTDTTAGRAVIAVQGPQARDRLATFWPEAAAVGRFRVARCSWMGVQCTVAGTGYTGEAGLEIAAPADLAPSLWRALLDAGVRPAGLGARDTLRLEAGLPLHGHELGPGITPLQAGLGWVIGWSKAEFRGKAALEAERDRGVARTLVGIVTEGRRPPRAGSTVHAGDSQIGEVTSGNFSPVLERGIALALVSTRPDRVAPAHSAGELDGVAADVEVDVRGTRLAGRLVSPPFVRR